MGLFHVFGNYPMALMSNFGHFPTLILPHGVILGIRVPDITPVDKNYFVQIVYITTFDYFTLVVFTNTANLFL